MQEPILPTLSRVEAKAKAPRARRARTWERLMMQNNAKRCKTSAKREGKACLAGEVPGAVEHTTPNAASLRPPRVGLGGPEHQQERDSEGCHLDGLDVVQGHGRPPIGYKRHVVVLGPT